MAAAPCCRKSFLCMTIKDIAKESGYAIGTVSRVLNNNPSVSPAARAKILEVIKRYNYQPNPTPNT